MQPHYQSAVSDERAYYACLPAYLDMVKPHLKLIAVSGFQVAGMICFYVITRGKHPFEPADEDFTATNVEENIIKNDPDLSQVDPLACYLLNCMLVKNAGERSKAEHLLK